MPLPKWMTQLLAELGLAPAAKVQSPPPVKSSAAATQAAPRTTAPVPFSTPPTPAPQKPVVTAAPPAQPQPQKVTSDTILRVSWLKPLDDQLVAIGVGFQPIHVPAKAPAGSTVFVDERARRARIIYPNGHIRAWDGFARLDVHPGEMWKLDWLTTEDDDRSIMFCKMDDNCDDEIIRRTGYEFASKGIEGREARLWPEYIRIVKDPFLNPHGFPLRSGIYVQSFVSFDVNFGEDGSQPSLTAIEDTLPPTLDFPFKTEIAVRSPLHVGDSVVEPGTYNTEVMGYNVETGEATHIEIKRWRLSNVCVNSQEMAELIHEGKVDILNVVQNEMPNL